MSAHDADLTLRQIAEVCDKAVELKNSMTREEFRSDWRKQMLGERLVEVLGEAVKRLPEDLRNRYPQLPWRRFGTAEDRSWLVKATKMINQLFGCHFGCHK